MRTILALLTTTCLLAACSQEPSETVPESSEPAATAMPESQPEVSVYAAAVASETRPEGDRASDAGRKPEAVLEFFGIQPDDVVLEMWAGGGYYTELLSHLVGAQGKVVAHANTPILNFAGEAHPNRHARNMKGNMHVEQSEHDCGTEYNSDKVGD